MQPSFLTAIVLESALIGRAGHVRTHWGAFNLSLLSLLSSDGLNHLKAVSRDLCAALEMLGPILARADVFFQAPNAKEN